MKPKPIHSDEFQGTLGKTHPAVEAMCRYLAGEKVPEDEVRGCDGAMFDTFALVRKSDDEREYQLCINVGGRWQGAKPFASYDPAILAIKHKFIRVSDPERDERARAYRERERERQRQAEAEDRERKQRLREREAEWQRNARLENEARLAKYGV